MPWQREKAATIYLAALDLAENLMPLSFVPFLLFGQG